MKIVLATFLLSLFYFNLHGQSNSKISGFLTVQYNKTLYDYAPESNPWGIGLNFQSFLNTNSKFKPTLDISADFYFINEVSEALLIPPPLQDALPRDSSIDYVIGVLAGYSYQFTDRFFATILGGMNLIDGKYYPGMKASIKYHFSTDQKFIVGVSFSNVFNRINKQDFGSVTLSLGRRIF